MKINLTKLLESKIRTIRFDYNPIETTDGSYWVNRTEGTSPELPYCFELDPQDNNSLDQTASSKRSIAPFTWPLVS